MSRKPFHIRSRRTLTCPPTHGCAGRKTHGLCVLPSTMLSVLANFYYDFVCDERVSTQSMCGVSSLHFTWVTGNKLRLSSVASAIRGWGDSCHLTGRAHAALTSPSGLQHPLQQQSSGYPWRLLLQPQSQTLLHDSNSGDA